MRGKGLLGSAKPGDIVPSDRSAANNTDDGYQGEACPCLISSVLITVFVTFTVSLSEKLGKNYMLSNSA